MNIPPDYLECGGCEDHYAETEFVPVNLETGAVMGVNDMDPRNNEHTFRCPECAEDFQQNSGGSDE